MPLEKQIQLLEAYVATLQVEREDFIATWGKDGKGGVNWLDTEIHSTLKDIARIKISLARGEDKKPGNKPLGRWGK